MVKLWAHQEEAIKRAKGKSGFALFFSMGTGKTATTIHILSDRYLEKKQMLRTLVLCPPIVIQNWKREFGLYSRLKPQDIVCLTGTGFQRTKLIEKNINADKIFVTNYESLLMKDVFQLLLKWHVEILVCDESHRLKNPSAKKSKQARLIGDSAQFTYLLTGTPVLNSPLDLFSQYRVMDGGKTFGTNFYAYRNTYFYDKNSGMPAGRYFPKWTIKPGAIEDIRKKLEATSMSVKKEDCLDLPPLIRQTVTVELGKDQKKAYESMKKDFIAFVENKACVANLAITKALRLQQILSGHLPTEGMDGEKDITVFKDNPRESAARELISDITEHSKLLVWACFKLDFVLLKKICEDLKVGYQEVHGEISQKNKMEAIDQFNTNPEIKVFIGHPASGGIGANLTAASYSLFYSRNFSLENDLQAEARNHRGGSEIHEKITRIDIVAENTLDELILERLRNKQAIGESLIRKIAEELKDAG